MVMMDPYDPESVERASAMIDLAQIGSVLRNMIFVSWIRLHDIDAVESQFRGFVDRALRDFRSDKDGYMLSINMGQRSSDRVSIDDDIDTPKIDEQQLRITVFIHWIGLPLPMRKHDTHEREFRRIVENALSALRSDPVGFGSEFH